ncbi:Protein C8orf37-like protein, partial [Armadillidium vulgare]
MTGRSGGDKDKFSNTENTSSKLRKKKNKSNLLGLDEDIDEILNDTDISTKGKHNFGEEAPLRCCNNLGCLSCDSQVVCFEGFRWRDSTDYLFLRTNYPDGQKLKAQMEPSRPTCSYCCQC